MCGIFGYVGKRKSNLSGFLLESLSKLEYRGYDSSGIVVLENSRLKIKKEIGEIKNLKKLFKDKIISGSIGLGHTRWATHGGVTRKNSHPHMDCGKETAVVHNGIIENYEKLKNELLKKGHKFVSDTDSEVASHLIEEYQKKNNSFMESVRRTFNKLEGLNAIAAVSTKGEIVAFRNGSPLVAGIGEDENYICSDIPTLSGLTEKIVLLNDGEGVLLKGNTMFVVSAKTGKQKEPKEEKVTMEETSVNKGKFKHFFRKEIYEQPEVLMRVSANNEKDIRDVSRLIKNALGTYFSACGTASYAGLAATYMFSEISKMHVNFAVASEFPYLEHFLEPRSLLIVASQSGETMDTLEAVRAAKRHGSRVLALVNVPGSSLERMANKSILLKAGPEKCVLSTKSYIAKLSLFLLIAHTAARKYKKGVNLISLTSKKVSTMLSGDLEKNMKSLAKKLVNKKHIYVIGRGINYPTALEGALKIKEASYIHAEGFAGGELKHGPIALIEKKTPCIAIVAEDEAKESILSNAMELKSRGGYIIGISPTDNSAFDYHIKVPNVKMASPIVNIIPMQLLAYHLTLLKGYNPDRPRNLAKAVTVK